MIDLAPGDRILLLGLPPLAEIRRMALRVPEGMVVAMADRDAVYDARANLRDLGNVMIAPADPEGVIPWKDEFFSAIYAPTVSELTPEMLRVVIPGGTIVIAGGPVTRR